LDAKRVKVRKRLLKNISKEDIIKLIRLVEPILNKSLYIGRNFNFMIKKNVIGTFIIGKK
jgi:hypothetical protein